MILLCYIIFWEHLPLKHLLTRETSVNPATSFFFFSLPATSMQRSWKELKHFWGRTPLNGHTGNAAETAAGSHYPRLPHISPQTADLNLCVWFMVTDISYDLWRCRSLLALQETKHNSEIDFTVCFFPPAMDWDCCRGNSAAEGQRDAAPSWSLTKPSLFPRKLT